VIVDVHTHVTPNGAWFNTSHDARVITLLKQMDEAHVEKAVIIGLPGYITNDFIYRTYRNYPDRLLPVGSFNPVTYNDKKDLALEIRKQFHDGPYIGVKLHPRLNAYDIMEDNVFAMFDEISSWNIKPMIWIDTLLYYPGAKMIKAPVEALHNIASRYPSITFILSHAGGPDILRLAYAIRGCSNAYLDLSLVITKLIGSSVENDIKHLLDNFEKRMIFGTDFPEVNIPNSLYSFKEMLKGKKRNAEEDVMGNNFSKLLFEGGANGKQTS